MKRMWIKHRHTLLVMLLFLSITACGSSDNDDPETGPDTTNTGLNGAEEVTGEVRLANDDPFPGATI